jgi:hypothetical protein
MTKRYQKNLAGAVSRVEMRDRLERARAALSAVSRAPRSKPSLALEAELAQQIGQLEKDLYGDANIRRST